MTGVLRSLAYHYREGGIGQILRKIGFRIRELIWSETVWLIYRIDLAGYRHEPKLPLLSSQLGFDALCKEGYFKAKAYPEMTRARIEAGETCNGFFLRDEAVNFAWTSQGRLVLEVGGLSVDEENCVGIADCYTLPAHRAKGIYPDTLILLARRAQNQGATSALIAVDPGNIPSIKGIERAGFVPHFRLARHRRFGRTRFERSEFQPLCQQAAHT